MSNDQELKIGEFARYDVLIDCLLFRTPDSLLALFYVRANFIQTSGSLSLSLLGGKIIFHNVEYRTKNAVLLVLEGVVSIHWWTRSVRERGKSDCKSNACLRSVLTHIRVKC